MLPTLTTFKKICSLPAFNVEKLFTKKAPFFFAKETFVVKVFPQPEWHTKDIPDQRIGIITGKKAISRFAVHRNRAKRRLKTAITNVFLPNVPKGYDYLFTTLAPVVTEPWPKLIQEMESLVEELNAAIKKRSGNKKTSKPSSPRTSPTVPSKHRIQ
ncbi:uncharacterized protein BYT42DRAFT_554111 [Radiomyces spectabilis]|uniref:uncharacterized protein n=1 Tax=Radiomyces spectabilis TaxID=64574 RepID=UPI0022203A63|nr:uncharacterized protein BYT42DRAFT_554111 [Radiomyces spectabilis]KAI8394293.1 hypothetical protein BYT42DRAFT_554111 [Radiomyces spectabilis]